MPAIEVRRSPVVYKSKTLAEIADPAMSGDG
jgi:hypothetical protein